MCVCGLFVCIHLSSGCVEGSLTLEANRLLIWTLFLMSFVVLESQFLHCKMEMVIFNRWSSFEFKTRYWGRLGGPRSTPRGKDLSASSFSSQWSQEVHTVREWSLYSMLFTGYCYGQLDGTHSHWEPLGIRAGVDQLCPMAASALQRQIWVVTRKTIWSIMPNILTVWPLTGLICLPQV